MMGVGAIDRPGGTADTPSCLPQIDVGGTGEMRDRNVDLGEVVWEERGHQPGGDCYADRSAGGTRFS